uniref:Secreted protein n=1 Tax=Taenia asiatica TaxID=60517 RepID=A0A0R3WDI6_TAEAS
LYFRLNKMLRSSVTLLRPTHATTRWTPSPTISTCNAPSIDFGATIMLEIADVPSWMAHRSISLSHFSTRRFMLNPPSVSLAVFGKLL